MARKLTVHVHAVERLEDGSYGRSQTFGPDDAVPDWAQAVITNPDVWDGEPEARDLDVRKRDDSLEFPENRQRVEVESVVKQPPRKGPGSGGPAWVEFAKSVGVAESFDSKEALIGYLEDNGHIKKG